VDAATFWQLIEDSRENAGGDPDEQAEQLTDLLSDLPPDEIVAFDRMLHELLAAAYRWDLWGAASIINGGCSDDAFEYFRLWLIAQGERVYREALADPETLVDRAEPDATDAESLLYAAGDAYRVETGRDLPARAGDPSEPAGERWNEGDLKHLFPKLWAAFPYGS
jgi:hypothetical protein